MRARSPTAAVETELLRPFWRTLAIRLKVKLVRDFFGLVYGLVVYRMTGRTPPVGHFGLVGLFCETGGRSNDFLHAFISKWRPPLPLTGDSGVLGRLDATTIETIAERIRVDGYAILPTQLPDALCDQLLEYALTTPAEVRIGGSAATKVYVRDRPEGVRYEFPERVIVRSEAAQALMADPLLLAIAQSYLGSAPVLDLVAMWWHTRWATQPDKDAGQWFHFDMDRIKWLKFFFYLTDVDSENGPHSFVAGSHRTGAIPRTLLLKGQVRLSDADVLEHYSQGAMREFTGRRGVIIAEDTRGLHKGKHVEMGDRLVFQLEFSDSHFGATYPDPKSDRFSPSAVLREAGAKYRRVYDRYLPGGSSL